jgi:hypothetical protein
MDSTIVVAIIAAIGSVGAAAVALLKKSGADEAPQRPPEVTRDFIVGRWQVEQKLGLVNGQTILSTSGGSDINYQADGKFVGSQFLTIDGDERKVLRAGQWDFAKLSDDTFRMKIRFDDHGVWSGDFQIVGKDRIHNIGENYDAFRI